MSDVQKDQQFWYNGILYMAHISNRWLEGDAQYGYTSIDGVSYKVKYNPVIDAWETVFDKPLPESENDTMAFFYNGGYAGI